MKLNYLIAAFLFTSTVVYAENSKSNQPLSQQVSLQPLSLIAKLALPELVNTNLEQASKSTIKGKPAKPIRRPLQIA